MEWMRLPNVRHRALAVLALLAALVACGGGGGSTLPAAPQSTAPQSTPSSSVPTPQALATISSGGNSVALSVTASVAVTASADSGAPSGTSPLLRRRNSTATGTPLFYFTVSSANQSTFSLIALSATFTLAAAPATPVYLAYWNNTEWDNVSGTAANVSGATVTISGMNPNIDATSGSVYFVLYSGAPLQTASPGPSPSTQPSTSPSASATASSTSSPTTSPTSAAVNPCMQTPNPNYQNGVVINYPTGFFSALEASKQACISVYTPSGEVMSAMETAARNGSAVTVIFPAEEYTSEESNASTLAGDGVHVVWLQDTQSPEYVISATPAAEYIANSYLPIHAKFALVDGVAYMDGHNWFESDPTDVILEDQNPADYTAIQTDLTTFPSAPPTVTGSNYVFTTDKYNSLNEEASMINAAGVGAGDTILFMSESFLDYGNSAPESVFNALLTSAKAGAAVYVVVEGTITSSYEACALSILAYNGANIRVQSAGGSEKILMISNSTTVTAAWMGSSNMTDYDYIDWGMTIPVSNTSLITELQGNYDIELGEAVASPSPAASPTCSP
jgi:predicted small lipoprotein YifL